MQYTNKHNILFLALVILCSLGFGSVWKVAYENDIALVTTKRIYTAGERVILSFTSKPSENAVLLINSSYGQTVVTSENENFEIPGFIAEKKGNIQYTLISETQKIAEGDIYIQANPNTKIQLESYVGPPSIIAGKRDYTMHVVVPTDCYDNPLPDSTSVTLKHQFLDNEKENVVLSKDMIAWENIFSYEASGRLLIFSQIENVSSKEFSVDVFSDLPVDFEIKSNRKHSYADGNQIIEFETSILKDQYGNIISDGTWVQFIIKDSKQSFLRTQGSTIQGKAIGKILHPDHEESWKVEAIVPGMAKSNTLAVSFKPVIEDFKVQRSQNNREITIGPILSFMDQLIPDGAWVTLVLKHDDKEETLVKTTSEGKAKFVLRPEFYPSKKYEIEVRALGITKTLKEVALK